MKLFCNISEKRGQKRKLRKAPCALRKGLENEKSCESFVVADCRSGNAAGDSDKATLWHTQQHRLVLLYPYPDTVRECALHKTLLSTFLTACGLPQPAPRKAFSPAIADCRFRAPLTPHLAQ